MTPQTEMSWRDKAGVVGVSGVGGASLPIENIKDSFPLEISRISSHRKLFPFSDFFEASSRKKLNARENEN